MSKGTTMIILDGRSKARLKSGEDRGSESTGGKAPKATVRWAMRAAATGLVCLALFGCAGVEDNPSASPADRKEPPAAMTMAGGMKENPLDELNRLAKEQPKLAITGGAALLIALVLGVGIGRMFRGAPRSA